MISTIVLIALHQQIDINKLIEYILGILHIKLTCRCSGTTTTLNRPHIHHIDHKSKSDWCKLKETQHKLCLLYNLNYLSTVILDNGDGAGCICHNVAGHTSQQHPKFNKAQILNTNHIIECLKLMYWL